MRKPSFLHWLAMLAPCLAQADTAVVFNEVMYHPATNEPAMEWIEFHNQLAVDVDISDWSVRGGVEYTFPSNTIVRGRGFLLLASAPEILRAISGQTNVHGPFSGRLSNNGELLELRNNSGRVVDAVEYGVDGNWPVGPDGAGVSLAKADRDLASSPTESWTVSEQIGGTPGIQNFVQTIGFVAPAGLISYWSFNEASGASAVDQADQNHGALGGGVTRTAAGIGGGLLFGGVSNAFVNVGPGTMNNFAVSNGLTIEAVLSPGWNGTNSAVIFRKAPRRPGIYREMVLANQPLAYWRLDDSTTTILDTTAHGRNGTATAGVQLNQPGLIPTDPANAAVRATGNQRITIPGFEKIGPSGYTVEFWVRVHALPTGCCQNLVGDGESANDFFMMNYILGPAQGLVGAIRPHYSFANMPVSLDSPTALQVNNTYHVVTTWDASVADNNAVIYINGAADRIGTVSRNVPAPGTTGNNMVFIGYDNREVPQGNYTYDEVALYDYPLSAASVAEHYAAATATNFDASLGNAVQLAFQNDGNNANANPPVASGPVLSFGLTAGGIYSELDMPLDGQSGRPTLAALQDGQPHHVAAAYDPATGLKAIYLDGVVRFSTTLSGNLTTDNGAAAILGNGEINGSEPFTGALDEVAFWGRALSSAEVTAHASAMQAGRNYFGSTTPATPITVVFNEVAGATNNPFWVEIVNYGALGVALDGYLIHHDGAMDHPYVIPPGTLLEAGGYLSLTSVTLGFQPSAGDKIILFTPARTQVLDGIVVDERSRARSAPGTGRWLFPDQATPGAANSFAFRDEIVINEIMYHQRLIPATETRAAQESPEAWIELYNRSGNPVDLAGWKLDGGINYDFTPGQMIPAGGYLVIADDAAFLRALYPAITIIGDFAGGLSGKSDRIVLRDSSGNPADEVHYFDNGRWPEYADGGGSTLELRDPNADNSKAEAWAASDETGKSQWQTFTYRAVAAIPSGSGQPTQWNDFILGLLSDGECLVDDLSVVESPAGTPVQFLNNGDFENGLTGWRVLGTHGHSQVIVDPDDPGNQVLHVIATGYQEHMHNHIEATYLPGRTVQNGREYQISFRARWLAGNNLLNTRLYFNRVARSTPLPTPALSGTPGAQNSRYAPNIGPTFSQFQHQPVVPKPGEAVTVSVVAEDPQNLRTNELWWSAAGGAWNSAPMAHQGNGLYSGVIAGQAAGTVVQFYVRAVDGLGAAAMFPARGPESGALYTVDDGQANLNLAHNVRIIMSRANTDLLHAFTNVMSNDLLPCTVVYDERRAYYDCAVHLRGSQRGRYSDTRTGFHINFPPDDLFRGVHPVMLIDRSGAGDATANRQEEIVIKHIMNRAGGLPGTYSEICRVITPRSAHTGSAQFFPRHEDLFIETAFENGGDGTLFEMELIYYPTTANAAGYKNPQPDNVIGTDVTNLGNDKEIYRYNFMIKNHRDEDDYQGFIALGKAWSLTGAALDAQSAQVMDIDQWMRAYALVSLCSVGDMYTFGNNHNFFIYQRPADGKFVYFPWDMDFAFTGGATRGLVGDQNLGKLVNRPGHLRRFYAHCLDIINVAFNSNYMAYWNDHYDNFAPGQNYSGSLNTIGARATFVRNLINTAAGNTPFDITSMNFTSSNLLASLSGTAPVAVQTIKVNGKAYPVTWTSVTAWRIAIPVSEPTNVLEVVGHDLRGNALTNFIRTAVVDYSGPPPDPVGAIVINEIMYNPAKPDAAYVELYNRSSFSFDLSGWRINGLDYTFPAGSIMTNGQYLVVVGSMLNFNVVYGTNAPAPFDQFNGNLQNDGETLTLLRPGPFPGEETAIDKVRYEGTPPWPAAPNGTGPSLQLIDATEDNSRVGNWSDGEGWRFYSFTGTPGANATNFQLFLAMAGDVYLDELSLVEGAEPGVGVNLLANGDFESGALIPWRAIGNHSNTVVSADIAYAGAYSLHIIGAAPGSASSIVSQPIDALISSNLHTFSFWFLPSTNGSGLNFRVTTSFRSATPVNYRPVQSTPGTANSVASIIPPFPALWLNEVQAENLMGIRDAQGEREPWIEIYNAGSNVINLDGYYLANSYSNLAQWAFPAGASIQPGEFKIIFADSEPNESTASEWHANFRPAASAGSVALIWTPAAQPQVLDYFNYVALLPDRSYGAYADGQPFDRQQFYRVTPGAANDNTAPPITVLINEWMASNTATLINTNHSNRYDDWFELHNPADTPADLSGYYLTDNLANKVQFAIPAGYVIPPSGFLLVWADGEPTLNSTNDPDLHVNFALSRDGDAIGLFASDGTLIDSVTFEPQFTDFSQGRYTDGLPAIYFLETPTPRGPNSSWANRYPTLGPIADAAIGVGETLTFAAVASDPDSPPQSLAFELGDGAPTGATIDPVSGVFSWMPTLGQAPGTNLITIRVTDNGTPVLSAERSFAVIAGIRITTISQSPAGEVSIGFGTLIGKTYRVEYKNDLNDETWTPLGPDVVATSSSLTITDNAGEQPQRFYRIVQVD